MKMVLTATLMVAALAGPALAQHTVPFRGTLQAAEVDTGFQFPLAGKHLEGTGQATHLGKFRLVSDFAVDVTNFTAAGTFTMTAANGDTIVGTSLGVASVLGATANITETYTITGGTGRFADASGTIVIWRVLATTTGLSAAVMEGVIAFGQ
jgi:hypothetical protein